MPGARTQNLQYNLNIDTQIIRNLEHLLYSNVNRSCFGHPLCNLSQDRQLSGATSFELIYPGIRSHSGCPQDLFPKWKLSFIEVSNSRISRDRELQRHRM